MAGIQAKWTSQSGTTPKAGKKVVEKNGQVRGGFALKWSSEGGKWSSRGGNYRGRKRGKLLLNFN